MLSGRHVRRPLELCFPTLELQLNDLLVPKKSFDGESAMRNIFFLVITIVAGSISFSTCLSAKPQRLTCTLRDSDNGSVYRNTYEFDEEAGTLDEYSRNQRWTLGAVRISKNEISGSNYSRAVQIDRRTGKIWVTYTSLACPSCGTDTGSCR